MIPSRLQFLTPQVGHVVMQIILPKNQSKTPKKGVMYTLACCEDLEGYSSPKFQYQRRFHKVDIVGTETLSCNIIQFTARTSYTECSFE